MSWNSGWSHCRGGLILEAARRSEQTELVVPQKDNQDVAVKHGSRLKISYVENAGKNVATKIEIIQV
jgi:hypothetical protein